jgi:hypothetical protein
MICAGKPARSIEVDRHTQPVASQQRLDPMHPVAGEGDDGVGGRADLAGLATAKQAKALRRNSSRGQPVHHVEHLQEDGKGKEGPTDAPQRLSWITMILD